jgi:mediator of RNA polymerase II transcription subunit 5
MDQPRLAVREALQFARAGKAPWIDVDRCLTITSSSKFIQLLWSELSAAASLGQLEDCRRIATFIFVVFPRSPSTPRLLPLFIHMELPSLIAMIDRQQPQEHGINVELMVTIISAVLTAALHVEWAVHTVCDSRHALGPSTMSMARRLAADLRGRKHSRTSTLIAQRLTSSPSFVANFPMFMSAEI